jgi:hypothetical protein
VARRRADLVGLRMSLAFAQALAPGVSEEVRKGLLMDARRWMDELARQWEEECLAEAEEYRVSRGPISEDQLEDDLDGLDHVLGDLREDYALGRIPKDVEERADELLRRAGRTVTEDERRTFCRRLHAAELSLLQRDRRQMLGDFGDAPPPLDRIVAPTDPQPRPSPTLAEGLARYLYEHASTGAWRFKTEQTAKSVLGRFVELVGPERTLESVTKEDVRRFRDALQQGKRPAGPETVNEYLDRYVGGLMVWARRNEYISGNPARGLRLPVRVDLKGKRHPFTDEELARIFSGDYERLSGIDYWLPLVLLHTGARNEEGAQLAVGDVERLADDGTTLPFDSPQGTPCFRIRAAYPWQRLKTPQSERTIPLHPALVELGFLDFVAEVRRAGHERLFSGIGDSGGRGINTDVSRRFLRRLRRLEITDRRKVLDSVRHTFQDRLYHADVQETVIERLMGHKTEGETFGRYGGKIRPQKLLDAIERLDTRAVLEGLLRPATA